MIFKPKGKERRTLYNVAFLYSTVFHEKLLSFNSHMKQTKPKQEFNCSPLRG